MRASVHVGPKGGTEYRLWSDDKEGVFWVVGRYKALPHMTPEETAKADAMESARKAAAKAASEYAQCWRDIKRGG